MVGDGVNEAPVKVGESIEVPEIALMADQLSKLP